MIKGLHTLRPTRCVSVSIVEGIIAYQALIHLRSIVRIAIAGFILVASVGKRNLM
jgi:hypothetical protein